MLIAEVRARRIGKRAGNEGLSGAILKVLSSGLFKIEMVFCKMSEQEALLFIENDLLFMRKQKKETHETRSVPRETINPGVKCLNTP